MPEILSQHYRRRLVGATIAPYTHTHCALDGNANDDDHHKSVADCAKGSSSISSRGGRRLPTLQLANIKQNAAAVPVEHCSLLAVMMMMAK